MLPRPATLVTAVVVTFAIAGVLKLSTRNAAEEPGARATPSRLDSERDQNEIEVLESTLYAEAPAPTVDPAMIDDLVRAIATIEALSDEGRRACDELGEPFYDFERPGAAGEAHIETWNRFAREWDDDVTEAATRLPAPPAWDADVDVTTSYQEVANALQQLRHATIGSGTWPVPTKGEWSARFDEANRLLEASRARLSTRP